MYFRKGYSRTIKRISPGKACFGDPPRCLNAIVKDTLSLRGPFYSFSEMVGKAGTGTIAPIKLSAKRRRFSRFGMELQS